MAYISLLKDLAHALRKGEVVRKALKWPITRCGHVLLH